MKKLVRICALLLVCCFSLMLAGCDLTSQNNAKYYNQTVITVDYKDGSKIEISRQEFLTSFNNYGQNLMNSFSYTEERAIDATVTALVNRKIILKKAKEEAEVDSNVALTTEETRDLYYQTYESLISNVRDFEEEIREYWDIEKEPEMTEEVEEGTVYKPYEKIARPVYDSQTGSYRIQLIEEDNIPSRDRTFTSIDEVYNDFIAETKNNTTDNQSAKFLKEGYRRYLANLQATQKVLGTNYNEEKLVKEEITRIFENLKENELISKYQKVKHTKQSYSNVTVDQVLNKYESMLYTSKFVYDNDTAEFGKDMLESFKDVNYFINDDYFYVAHILIKFNDEEQAKYDELEDLSNKGQGYIISADAYNQQLDSLYGSLKADEKDLETGLVVNSDSISVDGLLKNLQIDLQNAQTKQEKDAIFKDYMYRYNEDGGIMNADYPYIIGETDSKMVESFTEESRTLNNNGEYGAISGAVRSEYGVHIIYYMGTCENLFTINKDEALNLRADYKVEQNGTMENYSDILELDNKLLNPLHNKSVFDLVFDELYDEDLTEFENLDISTIQEEIKEIKKVDKMI